MQDVYENIAQYNPGRKFNVLIVFDDIIPNMISNDDSYYSCISHSFFFRRILLKTNLDN